MTAGFSRPRPPDYLAIACRCLQGVLKIDKSLVPYMEEQVRLEQSPGLGQELDALLKRLYGPEPPIQQ